MFLLYFYGLISGNEVYIHIWASLPLPISRIQYRMLWGRWIVNIFLVLVVIRYGCRNYIYWCRNRIRVVVTGPSISSGRSRYGCRNYIYWCRNRIRVVVTRPSISGIIYICRGGFGFIFSVTLFASGYLTGQWFSRRLFIIIIHTRRNAWVYNNFKSLLFTIFIACAPSGGPGTRAGMRTSATIGTSMSTSTFRVYVHIVKPFMISIRTNTRS